jgi:hypothetical protein
MTLRRVATVAVATAIAFAGAPSPARDSAGLGITNYVDVGDTLTDLLSTSGLAFSTMVIGAPSARDTTDARPVRASIRTAPATPAAPAPFVVETACPAGGSVKATMTDTDGSGGLSTRDRFVTVFDACLVDGAVVTGRSEFVVAVHRFEGSVEITELDFRFTELGTADLRWSGPARVTLRHDLVRGTEHYVVHYRDLVVTRLKRPMTWNFTLDMVRPPIGEQVARLDGKLSLGELRLRLYQEEPFVIAASGFPRSGVMSAIDERGARLQIEAGRSRYAYRLYRAGHRGDIPDSTSQSKPYGKR